MTLNKSESCLLSGVVVCLCVRTPFPLFVWCVCFSKKKKKKKKERVNHLQYNNIDQK